MANIRIIMKIMIKTKTLTSKKNNKNEYYTKNNDNNPRNDNSINSTTNAKNNNIIPINDNTMIPCSYPGIYAARDNYPKHDNSINTNAKNKNIIPTNDITIVPGIYAARDKCTLICTLLSISLLRSMSLQTRACYKAWFGWVGNNWLTFCKWSNGPLPSNSLIITP